MHMPLVEHAQSVKKKKKKYIYIYIYILTPYTDLAIRCILRKSQTILVASVKPQKCATCNSEDIINMSK